MTWIIYVNPERFSKNPKFGAEQYLFMTKKKTGSFFMTILILGNVISGDNQIEWWHLFMTNYFVSRNFYSVI